MDQEQKAKSSLALWVVGLVVVVPVLYVLSVGPAVMLYDRFPGQTQEYIETFYQPLEMVAERSTTLRHALRWYAERWK